LATHLQQPQSVVCILLYYCFSCSAESVALH